MSEPLYPIQKGAFTYYLKGKYNGIDFELVGFTIDGVEGFYKIYHSSYSHEEIPGHPCIDISEYLLEKLKAFADVELQAYIEENINDYTIYEKSDYSGKDIWENAGIEPDRETATNLDCSKIVDGIVSLSLNGSNITTYDFTKEEFTGIHPLYGDKDRVVAPLMAVYGEVLDWILAMEQHKRGIAPPVYDEMLRLRIFLQGKKSLKLVMKNGTVHEFKPHYGDISLFSILEDTGCEFVLKNSYYAKPELKSQPLAALDYLQYGRTKFVIDLDAINTFERPK